MADVHEEDVEQQFEQPKPETDDRRSPSPSSRDEPIVSVDRDQQPQQQHLLEMGESVEFNKTDATYYEKSRQIGRSMYCVISHWNIILFVYGNFV